MKNTVSSANNISANETQRLNFGSSSLPKYEKINSWKKAKFKRLNIKPIWAC